MSMDREQELWAAANMLINRHREDAWFHAAQRADELSSQGDLRGQSTYIAILRRIEQLTVEVTGSLNLRIRHRQICCPTGSHFA